MAAPLNLVITFTFRTFHSILMHLRSLLFIICIICFGFKEVRSTEEVCYNPSCIDIPLVNTSLLTQFCTDANFTIAGRCCTQSVNQTIQYEGLDLSQCNLTNTQSLLHLKTLKWIFLDGNPLDNNSSYHGLSEIKYLSLPASLVCPGGDEVWTKVNYTENSTICLNELDICLIRNVTCPDSSGCHADGPGDSLCLCDEGYHGYKCLRRGYFPYLLFVLIASGVTLVMSIFLWTTQRMHVKRKKEK